MSESSSDETEYWRSIRYQPLNTLEFSSPDEINYFRKLLGWSLYCDPIMTEHVVDQQLAFLNSAFGLIHQQHPTTAETRVLEIGCGPGYKADSLACRWGFSAYACDISDDVITFNRKHSPNIKWFVHDANCPLSEEHGSFDIIYTSMVLQHVKDKAAALAHIAQSLKPSGYLILIEESFNISGWRSDRTPGTHYLNLVENAGFDLVLAKDLLRLAAFLTALDYPIVSRNLYPFTTYRDDYNPQTARTKLIRLGVLFTIWMDRVFLSRKSLTARLNPLLRYFFPSTEIGLVCRKRQI